MPPHKKKKKNNNNHQKTTTKNPTAIKKKGICQNQQYICTKVSICVQNCKTVPLKCHMYNCMYYMQRLKDLNALSIIVCTTCTGYGDLIRVKEHHYVEKQNKKPSSRNRNLTMLFFYFLTFTYPLTTKVLGAPQMTSQPVFSIFPCLHCPLGLGKL